MLPKMAFSALLIWRLDPDPNFAIQISKPKLNSLSENMTFLQAKFSTTNNNINKLFLECEILKKYKINFITEDEGYAGSMDNLWLMSQFKYHIISNSSLYWWAAYFSQDRYKNGKIISTSNFANKDTCLYKWKL